MNEGLSNDNLLELAVELTIAWISNPNTSTVANDVPAFLQSVHATVVKLAAEQDGADGAIPAIEYNPAVSVRRSLASKDHIISLIDGKPYKMLKRHLAYHGLTPDQYRERYGLKPDYPIVAEGYIEKRRDIAINIGLGRKPKASTTKPMPASPLETTPAAEKKPAMAKLRKPNSQTPLA